MLTRERIVKILEGQHPLSIGTCFPIWRDDVLQKTTTAILAEMDEPLDKDKPTMCTSCDNSNGQTDEWCANYCHDETEQFCILKSRLNMAAREYLLTLKDQNKGEGK